jgi:hypothetical protein
MGNLSSELEKFQANLRLSNTYTPDMSWLNPDHRRIMHRHVVELDNRLQDACRRVGVNYGQAHPARGICAYMTYKLLLAGSDLPPEQAAAVPNYIARLAEKITYIAAGNDPRNFVQINRRSFKATPTTTDEAARVLIRYLGDIVLTQLVERNVTGRTDETDEIRAYAALRALFPEQTAD